MRTVFWAYDRGIQQEIHDDHVRRIVHELERVLILLKTDGIYGFENVVGFFEMVEKAERFYPKHPEVLKMINECNTIATVWNRQLTYPLKKTA